MVIVKDKKYIISYRNYTEQAPEEHLKKIKTVISEKSNSFAKNERRSGY